MRKLFVVNFAAPPMIRKVNKYEIPNLLVILHCNRHVPHFARLLQQKMKADRLEKYFFIRQPLFWANYPLSQCRKFTLLFVKATYFAEQAQNTVN